MLAGESLLVVGGEYLLVRTHDVTTSEPTRVTGAHRHTHGRHTTVDSAHTDSRHTDSGHTHIRTYFAPYLP